MKFALYWRSLIGLILILGWVVPATVFAQGSAGITVRPSIFEDSVEPGDIYSSSVRVTNETGSPQTYYVSVNDIMNVLENGRPVFAQDGEVSVFGIKDWISVPTEPIDVGANETIEIPFTITVPDNASPGTHLGGIFVGPRGERPEEIGTGVGFQVVPIVNMQVAGELQEEAKIRVFSTEKVFYGEPKVSFTVVIENQGNVAIKPRGPIEIKSMFGEDVGNVVVNEAAGLIVPSGARKYVTEWMDEDNLHFGRYTANATIVYGQVERKSLLRTISFWILPMNIIVPVLVGLSLLIASIYIFVKLYIRKHIRALEKSTGRKIKNAPRQKEPLSSLSFIAILLLVFSILFLMLLFIFFA
jgi:hypothetical protein